jgi:hypothetical protein
MRVHGRRFQKLPVQSQLEVLVELEEALHCGRDATLRVLVAMLIRDAAEAYFDAVAERCNRATRAPLDTEGT